MAALLAAVTLRAQARIVTGRLAGMRRIVEGIAARLGTIQTDPVESLQLYAVFNTSVAESERFWRSWISVGDQLADAERTRTVPDGLHADIDQCQKAWTAAVANAQRVGLNALGDGRRAEGRGQCGQSNWPAPPPANTNKPEPGRPQPTFSPR